MKRVRVIVEGATEEAFVSGPLAQSLALADVFLSATVLGVPGHKGGRVNFDRVRKDVLATLKQDPATYCTTLFDLYGCGDFPVSPSFHTADGSTKAQQLEALLNETVAKQIGEYDTARRFIPYFQVYEFEGLLFSDPDVFAESILQPKLAGRFAAIRASFASPEEINDSPETAPSKRILHCFPGYRKVISGSLAAGAIGIPAILAACPRFARWYSALAAPEQAS